MCHFSTVCIVIRYAREHYIHIQHISSSALEYCLESSDSERERRKRRKFSFEALFRVLLMKFKVNLPANWFFSFHQLQVEPSGSIGARESEDIVWLHIILWRNKFYWHKPVNYCTTRKAPSASVVECFGCLSFMIYCSFIRMKKLHWLFSNKVLITARCSKKFSSLRHSRNIA